MRLLNVTFAESPLEGTYDERRGKVQDFCVSVLIAAAYPTTGLPTRQKLRISSKKWITPCVPQAFGGRRRLLVRNVNELLQ